MSIKNEQAEKALLVQNHQLQQGQNAQSIATGALSSLQDIHKQNNALIENSLDDVDALLAQHGLSLDDIDGSPLSEDEESLIGLSEKEQQLVNSEGLEIGSLDTISIGNDWDGYINEVEEYGEKYSLDFNADPIRQILPASEFVRLTKGYDSRFGSLEWNQWDYGIVALSACLAFLTDYFIVRVPKDMVFKGKEYKGSPTTQFMRDQESKIMNAKPTGEGLYSFLHNGQEKLEAFAKVGYDFPSNRPEILGTAVPGLSPGSHRLQSYGHDPILGFVFGVIDIMRGSMTVVGRDCKIQVLDRSGKFGTHNIFEALILQISHLLSDIPTPQGVPAPYLSLLQCINMKSPFSLGPSGETVSFNDVSRFMYSKGYTLEHYLTMSLVPMIVELTVNTYYRLSNFKTLFPSKDEYDPSKDVKLKSMLCLAHSMTMSGNMVKMWMYGWNPLAFNLAEMVKCVKSFYSLYKARQARDTKIDCYLVQEWERLSAGIPR